MDMLNSGRELGLHSLKASVEEKDKQKVEPLMESLVNDGTVIRIKKNRWVIAGAS